jgi:hypothetical protein
MAINLKKYVDISTIFPGNNSGERGFGGLIFTRNEPVAPLTNSDAYNAYHTTGFAYMSLNDVKEIFGETSVEYKAAEKYYDYVSPSGRFASKLAFMKYGDSKAPTAVDALTKADQMPNISGFGSVLFIDQDTVSDLGSSTASASDPIPDELKELVSVATFNSETLANKYLIVVARTFDATQKSNYTAERAYFKDIPGVCYVVGVDVTSGVMPQAILGAIDFVNGQTTNFMFKMFDKEVPSITDSNLYDDLTAGLISFYGQTQTNGPTLEFYQRGYNTDDDDTALFCHEMWFKSACEMELLDLLTNNERIPANALGVDMVKLAVVDVCSDAVNNASFMPKVADRAAMKTIRQIVTASDGGEEAVSSIAADLETKGYSVYAYLAAPKSGSTEQYIAYYVFYGTADSIRFIEGNNVLI